MIRKQLYITVRQSKEIKKIAKRMDLTFSDAIRRILDYYLENDKAEDIVFMRALDDTDE